MSSPGSSKRLRQLLPAARSIGATDPTQPAVSLSSSATTTTTASSGAVAPSYASSYGYGQLGQGLGLLGMGLHDGDVNFAGDEEHNERKRIGTQLACNECRRRKARCDGQRPSCQACQKKSKPCIYTEKLTREASDTVLTDSFELLRLLKSVSETEALDILRMLRSSGDPAAVLAILKEPASSQLNPSDHGTSLSATDPSRSSLEFELMRSYPAAYPAVRPLAVWSPGLSDSVQSPYTRRIRSMDQRTILGTRLANCETSVIELASGAPMAGLKDNPFVLPSSADSTPPFSLPICDVKLHDLDISFWTDIPLSNELAANVISLYLRTDHPLLGIFDPILFVSDLVCHQTEYCSRFLVHALMYWGTMYTSLDESVHPMVAQFGSEAEKLWWIAKSTDNCCNIAGAQILSLAFMGNGRDHFVLLFLSEACRMAKRMSLLGVEPSEAVRLASGASPEMRSAYSYTAWGIFNWSILLSLFYQQPGLEYPEHPPVLPIPGECSEADKSPISRQNLSMGTTSPTSDNSPPWYMGDTFAALCRFWRILHGVAMVYYNKSTSTPTLINQHVSIDFAERKYRELLAWIETLPSSLMQSDNCPHHVMTFHLWFHAAILDIFRPFVQLQLSQQPRLATFSSKESSAQAAFEASVNQLKRLIVVYRSQYQSSSYTILWHTALIYVANAVLKDTGDPEWRFYFLHCIYGYESLRRSYRLAEAIGRALLSMTLRNGDITGLEARTILQRLKQRGLEQPCDEIRATFMGDLELALVNPGEAKVEILAEQFEDVALFQEFINMEATPSEDMSAGVDNGNEIG